MARRGTRFLLLAIPLLMLSIALPGSSAPLEATGGTGPFAYIADRGSNTVSVVDTSSLSTAPASVTVGQQPVAIVTNQAGTRVYVANDIDNVGDNTVSVIDTSTNLVTATIPVTVSGTIPTALALNPAGTRLYVANDMSCFCANLDNVSVIDTSSNTVIASIPVARGPVGLAVDPSGSRLYVTHGDNNTALTVIDTSTNSVLSSMSIGSRLWKLVVSPSGGQLYATDVGAKALLVLDATSYSVLATIPMPSATGSLFYDLRPAINSTGTRVYVTSGSSLAVVDTVANATTATVSPVANAAIDVALDPSGAHAYVTDGNATVSVVDTSSNSVVASVSGLPSGATAIAIPSPATSPCYISMESGICARPNASGRMVILVPGTHSPASVCGDQTVLDATSEALNTFFAGDLNAILSSAPEAISLENEIPFSYAGVNTVGYSIAQNHQSVVELSGPILTQYVKALERDIPGLNRIDIVSHSLGGLVTAYAMQQGLNQDPIVNRAISSDSPLQGYLAASVSPFFGLNCLNQLDPVYTEFFDSAFIAAINQESTDPKFFVVNNEDDLFIPPGIAYVGPSFQPVPGRSWTNHLDNVFNWGGHGGVFQAGDGISVVASILEHGSLPDTPANDYPNLMSAMGCLNPFSSGCLHNFYAVIFSPANLLVVDPQGRRVGYDPTTAASVNEISGATYSGPATEPQLIAIPDSLAGNYAVLLSGTASGTFHLFEQQELGTALQATELDGNVNPSQRLQTNVTVNSSAPPVLEMGSPAPPTVSIVSPASGPTSGGTSVTITGSAFTGTTSVSFGGVAATSFTVNSDTQISATAPAGAGIVDVLVTNATGTSQGVAADQFSYTGEPSVTLLYSLAPGFLPSGYLGSPPTNTLWYYVFSIGGPAISGSIGGSNVTLLPAVSMYNWGRTCNSNVIFVGMAAPPTDPSGIYAVNILLPSGQIATTQFTHTGTPVSSAPAPACAPTVTSISPSNGPIAGGTTVIINGSLFTGATAVSFGGTPATSFTVNSDTQITATAPAGAGTVDVLVTNATGTSASVSADQFGYVGGPTTFNVNDTSDVDDPPHEANCLNNLANCTLRAAIGQANALDAGNSYVINVPAGTFTLSRTPASALHITVASTFSISGAGALSTIVDGNNADSVLVINSSGAIVTVSGLTVQDGNSSSAGGGIYNLGTLTLSGVTVSGNTSTSNGGGVHNEAGATLVVQAGSTISGNTGGNGGGIGSGGATTVTDSTISGNTANGGSLGNPVGGGIQAYGSAQLKLANSTVSNNTAAGSGSNSSFGGGICVCGASQPSAVLTNSTVSGNSVSATSGSASGGGIDNSTGGTLTLTDSAVSNNAAATFGGGVANSAVLTLTNSTVTGNKTSSGSGGGIGNTGTGTLTLQGSSAVSNNAATTFGGGISNTGMATLTDSTVSNNTATTFGGGIDDAQTGTLTLTNSTVTGNQTSSGSGGGIGNANSALLTLTDSTVSNNSSSTSGGGISNSATLILANSTISGNEASAGTGGGIGNSGTLTANYDTIAFNSLDLRSTGAASLQGTIVSNSSSGINCSGTITDRGYNLSSDSTCGFTQPTSVSSQDPLLAVLALNTSNPTNTATTQTTALGLGSPAIAAIPESSAPGALCNPASPPAPLTSPLTDQRGVIRPQGDHATACSIGAYESDRLGGAAPAVTSVSPASGSSAGNTIVTVTGTNLTGATAVDFGAGNPGSSIAVNGAGTSLTVMSPPGTGTVDVTMTTPSGTSAAVPADQFAYVAAPTVTGISLAGGPAAGGTTVTVNGSGFFGGGVSFAGTVSFGGTTVTPATSPAPSDTQLTLTSPPGSGTVDIIVTTLGGTSAASSADQFTYIAPLVLTSPTSLNGVVGVSWSSAPAAQFSASGGVAPYNWTPTGSPPLPDGLMFDSMNGMLSGTPTTPGSYPVTIAVSDAETSAQTQSSSVTITIAPAPLLITTTTLPPGAVGQNPTYSETLTATGGTLPLTWSLAGGTSLPPGLTLSPSGAIAGTPTKAGTFSFTVEVTDSTAPTALMATQPLSIVVGPKDSLALRLPPASQRIGRVGDGSFSATPTGIGGKAPYTWSAGPGTLPPGLTINPSTGAITGTPTSNGSFAFTLDVSDSNNPQQTVSAQLTLVINPPVLTITTASPLTSGTVGTPYSLNFQATGGTPSYTWVETNVTPNTGPHPVTLKIAGLSLDPSTGILSGTPTEPGTATFVMHLKDSGTGKSGDPVETAKFQFTLTIAPLPLAITTASPLPAGTAGKAYSTLLAATGGYAPYSWSVVSGTLPSGLSLNAKTGKIAGSPTAAGTSTFTLQVADAGAGGTPPVTTTFSLTVALKLTPASLPGGKVGTKYSATLTASGGNGSYLFTVGSGSLPPGLTLTGNKITGTLTTAGTYPVTITTTDSVGNTGTQSYSILVSGP